MASLINALAATPAFGYMQGGGFNHMGYGWNPWHMMFGLGGLFLWLVFVGLIILLVLAAAGAFKGKQSEKPHQESALDILKKRYARGEINKEEFDRMKRDLQS